MKISAIVVFCFLLTVLPFAQNKSSTDKKNGTVSGVVVKEPGSQPLKKATITLVAEDQEEGGNYTITTDSEGHFSFDNVHPGRYRMLLERTGYIEVNQRQHRFDGRTLSLLPRQELKDLRLTMLLTATVLGRVVDEDGDPLPNVEVSALRKPYGKTQWEPISSERTNDLGEYRISGLSPGRYYFSASPPPDYQRIAAIETPSEAPNGQPDLRRVTTYYPNTTDRSQAASLDLRPGDETPVNFTMIPGRTFAVRGAVVALPPEKKAAVVLTAREYGLVFNAAEVDKNGKFEVRGVPPGSYTAMAFADDDSGSYRTARQRIDIVAGDVEDVHLAPVLAGVVRGQLLADRPAAFSQAYVMLRSLDDESPGFDFAVSGEMGNGSGARVNRDGSFEVKNVAAGKYAVEFMGSSSEWRNYFIRSVRLAGSAADTGFSVNGNAGPLLVTLSSRAAVIEGSAIDDHDKLLADCTVVAVPEEQFRKLTPRFGKSRTDQNGRFTIRGLAPGSYSVYAWQDLDGEPYFDPEFLITQQEFGKPVHAEGGERITVVVKAATIPVDSH
jgi:hypothetical protein